jgi:hypothetical protein
MARSSDAAEGRRSSPWSATTPATTRFRVTKGPFAETKEQLAGYLLVAALSLDLAIQLASKVPDARDGAVEVRQIWDR